MQYFYFLTFIVMTETIQMPLQFNPWWRTLCNPKLSGFKNQFRPELNKNLGIYDPYFDVIYSPIFHICYKYVCLNI